MPRLQFNTRLNLLIADLDRVFARHHLILHTAGVRVIVEPDPKAIHAQKYETNTVATIIDYVACAYCLDAADLRRLTRRGRVVRHHNIAEARHIAIVLILETLPHWTDRDVAEPFHLTRDGASYARYAVADLVATDRIFRANLQKMRAELAAILSHQKAFTNPARKIPSPPGRGQGEGPSPKNLRKSVKSAVKKIPSLSLP